jgi:hypothetical protein
MVGKNSILYTSLKSINWVLWYVGIFFSTTPFLTIIDSKDWSLWLSQSLCLLRPQWNRLTIMLVDRIHSYQSHWYSRCSVCYLNFTPLSWGTVIESRKPSK